jgi:hypothetical protein
MANALLPSHRVEVWSFRYSAGACIGFFRIGRGPMEMVSTLEPKTHVKPTRGASVLALVRSITRPSKRFVMASLHF